MTSGDTVIRPAEAASTARMRGNVTPYPFTFEYCQSALSSVRIETPASAETPRKNRVYSIHTGKSMAGGVVTPRDHNALTPFSASA
jgi:hypothetical protein